MKPEIPFKWKHRTQSLMRFSQFLGQKILADAYLGRIPPPKLEKAPLPPLWKGLKFMWELLETDRKNIEKGIYLAPKKYAEPLGEFTRNTLEGFIDLYKVKKRIDKKETQIIGKGMKLADFPDYFLQNFHHQSDGYMSEHSADLYDHQVETVFVGSANAMRRQVLVPIHEFKKTRKTKGKIKLLDIACGTGRFTKEIARNHPDFKITGSDLSPWYLKKAQEENSDSIEWVQANAEKLPFETSSFDIVTSVYLFHELPPKARTNVIKEMKRVLKPGGLLVIEDSLQWDDSPELNGSLELFPKLYHEPFFSGYVADPLEAKLSKAGFKKIDTIPAFYSKVLSARS